MRYPRPGLVLILILSLLPLASLAQQEPLPLRSDWMELVKGYRDPATGVEMREVQHRKGEDARTLTLSIPKSAMNKPADIEEILVIGRRPDKPEPLDITYEWVDDFDSDNYGLIIRLGKDSDWPIRLYIDSRPGYLQ